jgi:hypothetical protein
MYTAPLLDEIVSVVVHQLDAQLDKETLLALAITDRSLSSAALDVLWADSSIWSLAQRMDSSIWVLEEAESSEEYDKGDLVSIENLDTCAASDCSSLLRYSNFLLTRLPPILAIVSVSTLSACKACVFATTLLALFISAVVSRHASR